MRKKTTDLTTAVKAAAAIATGEPRAAIIEKYDITRRDYDNLRRLCGAEIGEFREAFKGELKCITVDVAQQLKDKVANIPAGQLPVAPGILMDKLATLEGLPSNITATATFSVGGVTAEKAQAIAAKYATGLTMKTAINVTPAQE